MSGLRCPERHHWFHSFCFLRPRLLTHSLASSNGSHRADRSSTSAASPVSSLLMDVLLETNDLGESGRYRPRMLHGSLAYTLFGDFAIAETSPADGSSCRGSDPMFGTARRNSVRRRGRILNLSLHHGAHSIGRRRRPLVNDLGFRGDHSRVRGLLFGPSFCRFSIVPRSCSSVARNAASQWSASMLVRRQEFYVLFLNHSG